MRSYVPKLNTKLLAGLRTQTGHQTGLPCHLRAVFTVNTPTLHSRVQSYSDNIHIFPFIATDIPVQFSPFHEIQVEKPEDDD